MNFLPWLTLTQSGNKVHSFSTSWRRVVALPPRRQHPVPTGYDAGWALGPVWTWLRRGHTENGSELKDHYRVCATCLFHSGFAANCCDWPLQWIMQRLHGRCSIPGRRWDCSLGLQSRPGFGALPAPYEMDIEGSFRRTELLQHWNSCNLLPKFRMRGAITPLFHTSLCYEAFKHWNKFTSQVLGRSRIFVVRKYVQNHTVGLCVLCPLRKTSVWVQA